MAINAVLITACDCRRKVLIGYPPPKEIFVPLIAALYEAPFGFEKFVTNAGASVKSRKFRLYRIDENDGKTAVYHEYIE